jgi:hypothetical protein
LELKSSKGIYCLQTENDLEKHARYYHLRVINQSQFTAHDVEVLLLGVERLDDEKQRPGELLYVPLPLGWANGQYPLARKIGSRTDATADLLFVREDVLRFVPVVTPNNFQSGYSHNALLRVTAIAQGVDCESNTVRLTIDWDGKWVRDDDAMQDHFKIDTLADVI